MHAPLAKFSMVRSRLETGPTIYAGPGDIVAASSWWGLRAYTLASIGTNLIRLREDGGNTEQDFLSIADGGLDLAAIATFKGANNLFVVKMYDQVGTIHMVQATAASQPKFTLSVLGSLPAVQATSTEQLSTAPTSYTQSQPFSFSLVSINDTGATKYLFAELTGIVGLLYNYSGGANTVTLTAPSSLNAAAVSNAWHAFQIICNGASSNIYIDGTDNIGNAGASGLTYQLAIFPFDRSNASVMEFGYLASDISSNRAALNAQQHSYYGF